MKQIVITIDTEVGELGWRHSKPFETFVEGRVGGERVGYQKIIELLDRYHARGEFFVDVYPTQQLGERRLATLCQKIIRAGHGAQLHTHPSTALDAKRRYLADYPATEQQAIIELGINRLNKWTGKRPLAHRAGGYGADSVSLKALAKAGLKFDSSYCAGQPACRLPHRFYNRPYRVGALWELPVSVYQPKTARTLPGRILPPQKLDYRYGSSTPAIIEAIERAPSGSIHVIFLHSFNFLRLPYYPRRGEFGRISVDHQLIANFEQLLRTINQRSDWRITDFAHLALTRISPDYLIEVSTLISTNRLRSAWRERIWGVTEV